MEMATRFGTGPLADYSGIEDGCLTALKAIEIIYKKRFCQVYGISDVENPIQWARRFGPRPYLQRYLSRGMDVAVINGDQKVFTASNNGQLKELMTKKDELESIGNECQVVLALRKRDAQRWLGEF
jgi:hypothetical protein